MKGFSLLELLIVIVIMGILATIIIPSLLLFIQQTRGTETQQTLALGLRAQEARHIEFGKFADGWEQLNLGTGQTQKYEYKALALEPTESAMLRAIPKTQKLRGYVAGIQVVIGKYGRVYKTVICKAKKVGSKAIEEAEVEFRKRRVVCERQFRRVN